MASPAALRLRGLRRSFFFLLRRCFERLSGIVELLGQVGHLLLQSIDFRLRLSAHSLSVGDGLLMRGCRFRQSLLGVSRLLARLLELSLCTRCIRRGRVELPLELGGIVVRQGLFLSCRRQLRLYSFERRLILP